MLIGGGVLLTCTAVFTDELMLLLPAALFVLIAGMVGHMRVWDDGEALCVRFGPIPLLMGTRVRYDEIERVEPSRTKWYHGWGIHGWPGSCLVFNLWGFGAVTLHLKGPRGLLRFRRYLIGTDEPDALAGFVNDKLADMGVQ